MSDPITIEANLISWAGVAVNIVITAFLLGAVYGRLTAKIAALGRELLAVKSELAAVNRKIATPEGEPLLMSYKAHDNICSRANDRLSSEMRHVVDALSSHSKAVSACGDQVSQLAVAVAILEEKFAHERQSPR